MARSSRPLAHMRSPRLANVSTLGGKASEGEREYFANPDPSVVAHRDAIGQERGPGADRKQAGRR